VYCGSRAERIPAAKIPSRVSPEAATSAAPAAAAAPRLCPATPTAPTAPATPRTRAARIRRPATCSRNVSATIPSRRSMSRSATSSATAPITAIRRAGAFSDTGAASSAKPAPALAAEPANTNGSSRQASCHAGTAVSAISAVV
jgi:hypothetical protein